MFSIGSPELLLILIITLIIIKPNKLPELAKNLAHFLYESRKKIDELKNSINNYEEIKEVKQSINETVNSLNLNNMIDLNQKSNYFPNYLNNRSITESKTNISLLTKQSSTNNNISKNR